MTQQEIMADWRDWMRAAGLPLGQIDWFMEHPAALYYLWRAANA